MFRTEVRRSSASVLAALLLLVGCASDDGSSPAPGESHEAAPRDASGGEGIGVELPGELDQRVVDAVAPISGASLPSARWLKDAMNDVALPSMSSCLEDRGRLDLLEFVEDANRFFDGSGEDPFLYPEPDRFLATGLGADEPVISAEEMRSWLREGGSPDGGVISACSVEGPDGAEIARANELQSAIRGDWARLVTEVSYGDEMMPHYEGFALCLSAEGVPDEAATGSPVDFIQWAEGARMALDADAAHELGLEQARQYVSCGEEMFEARAVFLRSERDRFIESHRDQIHELTATLVTLGIR